eukprot:5450034-Amphidinium_carterae.1
MYNMCGCITFVHQEMPPRKLNRQERSALRRCLGKLGGRAPHWMLRAAATAKQGRPKVKAKAKAKAKTKVESERQEQEAGQEEKQTPARSSTSS